MRRRIGGMSACLVVALSVAISTAAEPTWKAGTSKAVITPAKPMWMAGYGSRNHPAEGKIHDLWIKVLALEDASGHRAIVLTSDTLGIPKSIYENTCQSLAEKHHLDRAQIMLTASHTHCGPVLRSSLYDAYELDDEKLRAEQMKLIEDYAAVLERKIVETVDKALADLQPVSIEVGDGSTNFAVNRRNNVEVKVPELIRQHALKGPVDHAVPVQVARLPSGELKAIVFGYACHNTTMSFYQWCGDYAGFAQLALEDSHPGTVAMFYMGCGGDQNPLPRRNLNLSRRYGQMLASAVEETLLGPLETVSPTLKTEFEFVDLNLGAAPTREELQKAAASSTAYERRWGNRLLKQLDDGKPLARTYPYPLQAWKLGESRLWITMGGEATVEYSLGFKKRFGPKTWVTAYCNDVMAYIPSLRVLEEGGYEGTSSMIIYGQPARRWGSDIEELISSGVGTLVERVGGPLSQ